MTKYPIEVFWSDEDEGYIAVVSDLAGCNAWGKTEAEAIREAHDAIGTWIKAAKKDEAGDSGAVQAGGRNGLQRQIPHARAKAPERGDGEGGESAGREPQPVCAVPAHRAARTEQAGCLAVNGHQRLQRGR